MSFQKFFLYFFLLLISISAHHHFKCLKTKLQNYIFQEKLLKYFWGNLMLLTFNIVCKYEKKKNSIMLYNFNLTIFCIWKHVHLTNEHLLQTFIILILKNFIAFYFLFLLLKIKIEIQTKMHKQFFKVSRKTRIDIKKQNYVLLTLAN